MPRKSQSFPPTPLHLDFSAVRMILRGHQNGCWTGAWYPACARQRGWTAELWWGGCTCWSSSHPLKALPVPQTLPPHKFLCLSSPLDCVILKTGKQETELKTWKESEKSGSWILDAIIPLTRCFWKLMMLCIQMYTYTDGFLKKTQVDRSLCSLPAVFCLLILLRSVEFFYFT